MSERNVVLECKNLSKSFGKNIVLNNINLSIKKGEVHAILGANGAGKSTLVKIITGVYAKTSGDIFLNGRLANIKSPQDSERLGISIIHQDQQMVPLFDVTRNAYLGSEIYGKFGKLDLNTMRKNVSTELEIIKADFSADCQIEYLTVGQREQVAIVSALLKKPQILILDEPTASLSSNEINKLFEIIRQLKNKGVTIIYISHHLDEVFDIADRITILRDSKVINTLPIDKVNQREIISLMIGKELDEIYPKEHVKIGEVLLEIDNLYSGTMVNGVDLKLHKGEILGLAGLVGAGRTETMLALYGAAPIKSGSIKLNRQNYVPKDPHFAVRSGIAFIPEDRRSEGIAGTMSIAENLSLPATKLWAKGWIIRKEQEEAGAKDIIKKLNIKCTGAEQKLTELSGGNQQKVVVGKWLVDSYQIFIFDQPTTGVDVGAKAEIYKQMIQLAKKGCGIIFISSENNELLGICDRINVMYKGQIVKEFLASEATEKELLYWSVGGKEQEAENA